MPSRVTISEKFIPEEHALSCIIWCCDGHIGFCSILQNPHHRIFRKITYYLSITQGTILCIECSVTKFFSKKYFNTRTIR